MEEGTKRRLLSRRLLAPDNWLTTCISNFRSSDTYAPGQDKLEEYVFQQWLLVNLGELGISCFPPDLGNQLKVLLNGCYTCQIVSVIDTGRSAYSQYQEERAEDTENLSIDETDKFEEKWEPKPSRTLLLSLTDGSQELVALEVQRISSLSINLFPGCKAVIKGPVICRRGCIMLEKESQIEILGGKVESFLIPNAYENILRLNLGLAINEKARIATGEANETQGNQVQRNNTNTLARKQPNASVPSQDDFFDDHALLSIDLDNVMAMETQGQKVCSTRSGPSAGPGHSTDEWTRTSQQSRPKIIQESRVFSSGSNKPSEQRTTRTYDMDIDEELLSQFANDLEEAHFSEFQPSTSVLAMSKSQDSGCLSKDDDILCLEDESTMLQVRQNKVHSPTEAVNKTQNPLTEEEGPAENVIIKLADVKDISERKFNQATKVKVKVNIHRVVQTLNIKNNEWTIVVQITDGSAVLEVSLSSDVVTKIFGMSPVEGAKRRKLAMTDLAVRESLKEDFRRFEKVLKRLNCVFEVLIKTDQRPSVVDIQMQHT